MQLLLNDFLRYLGHLISIKTKILKLRISLFVHYNIGMHNRFYNLISKIINLKGTSQLVATKFDSVHMNLH